MAVWPRRRPDQVPRRVLGLLAFDFILHVRKAHVPTLKEAAIWSSIYVGIAIVFSPIGRTGFIFVGAALINSFAWVFYFFGLILRNRVFAMLVAEGDAIRKLQPKYLQWVRNEDELMALLRRAHEEHDASLAR
jgi:predicted tellurium resistance membrane protein TerC